MYLLIRNSFMAFKKQNWFSAMHHNWHMLQWDTLSVQWEFCVCKSFWISGMEYYRSQDSPTWLFCPCCCHYYCSGTILWLFKVCLLHTFFSQGHIIIYIFFILWWFSFSFSVSLSVLFLWTLLFSLSFFSLSLLTETRKEVQNNGQLK